MAVAQASSRRVLTASQYADILEAAMRVSDADARRAIPLTPFIDNDADMENGGSIDQFLTLIPTREPTGGAG